MTGKERLERIIQMQYDGYTIWDMSEDDLVWLVEQAERAYELESDSYNAHLERLLDRKEQQNERYRKAIKECIERMNAGGAGTRSFIYEKLIEVWEVEK